MKINPYYFSIACLLLIVQIIINSARWYSIIKILGIDLTFSRVLSLYYSSIFFNLFLPGTVGGDAYRILAPGKSGLPIRNALNSVIFERTGSVLGLVILIIATLPLLAARTTNILALNIGLIILIFTTAAFLVFYYLKYLPGKLRTHKIFNFLAALSSDARIIFESRLNSFLFIVYGIAPHVFTIIAIYVLAMTLPGNVSLVDCFALLPTVLLVIMVPVSVGGWGIREYSIVIAFGYIHLPLETSLALSVSIGVLALIVSIPGVLAWIHNTKWIRG